MSCLSQVDLSKKGSIDDQIMDLVQYINAKDNYFTTSSCSGRISVFSEVGQFSEEKYLLTDNLCPMCCPVSIWEAKLIYIAN